VGGVLREAMTISFGDGFVGDGWRYRQRHGDGEVRWTGPEPVSTVEVPVVTPAGSTVELLVVGAIDDELPGKMTLEVNGTQVPLTVSLEPDGSLRFRGTVRAHPFDDATHLIVRLPYTLPFPKPPQRPTPDPRVGVAMASIRLSPPHR
jgi:hypothetical protein